MPVAGQRGFTIIEALVAVMILAVAATAVIQTFAAGARLSAQRAARHAYFDEAQTRLTLIRAEVVASGVPFERELTIDGRIVRESARQAASAEGLPSPAALFALTVSISARDAPDRTVVTLTGYAIVGGPG